MEEVLVVVGMFVLRLGVPLALTLAVAYWLRRLDTLWQAQALIRWEQEKTPAELAALKTTEQPCWEVKGCDEASRAQCPACKLLDIPCWVARLRAAGQLPQKCYTCEMFSLSPA